MKDAGNCTMKSVTCQALQGPVSCTDPESFFRRGPTLRSFFFVVNEWIQIPLKSGHHGPASKTPFKWRVAGMPMIA